MADLPFHNQEEHGGWIDRHPRVAGAAATIATAGLLVEFARDLIKDPTAQKAVGAATLGVLTAAGIVETVRPDTFRLWERMENRLGTG